MMCGAKTGTKTTWKKTTHGIKFNIMRSQVSLPIFYHLIKFTPVWMANGTDSRLVTAYRADWIKKLSTTAVMNTGVVPYTN